jgi:cytochrome c-type biogenesis protein CcsB
MKFLTRILPWALLALFLSEIIAVFVPKTDKDLHLSEFGRLPVLMNGRVQPFDSVGRNALLQIRSTASVPLEEVPLWKFWHHARKLKSTEWLLEMIAKPEQANERPAFLIHHPELLRTLELDEKGIEKSGLRYYTYNEIEPLLPQISELATQFNQVEDKARTPYQTQLLKLAHALFLYQRLQVTLQTPDTHDLSGEVAAFEKLAPAGTAALRAREAGQSYDTNAFNTFATLANNFVKVAESAMPLTVPPVDLRESSRDDWKNFGAGAMDLVRTGEMNPAVKSLATIATSFHNGDAPAFNAAVDNYRQWLQARYPAEVRKGSAEFYFNNIQAFLHSIIIYVFAFLLASGALLTFAVSPMLAESLRKSAVWLIALAFAVHTFGLIFRMALEGRPPVTNLYSSAIFIGWGAVILGLALERFFKVGLGAAVGAFAGFVTLFIAHNLALGGDTMEMLQAVLDTNFWLATHVTTVTIGYASTFVAGLLGIAFVILGLFTPILKHVIGSNAASKMNLSKALTKMIYAIVCFATLFSFIGTVLGGIWADQSWGRFWGWDPKENGALIIVLWNALILHARWGGIVRERGLAVLSIFGNIVTSYSWFGVNMLGIGLHSYGFMDAAFKWLVLFIASQLALIALGSLPLNMWKSFSAPRDPKRTGSSTPISKNRKSKPISVIS